jgi:hypothetical protein
MFNKDLLGTLIVVILLSGCTATYNVNRGNDEGVQLAATKGVYIIIPDDGSYGDKQYANSGQMTASAVEVEFSKYAAHVIISDKCALDACLETLRDSKYGYLVEPNIIHWEDRATEWSGKPDKISVKISVYDLSSGDRLSQVILDGKSKWATFGGDHPQDLLSEPVSNYVTSLYD